MNLNIKLIKRELDPLTVTQLIIVGLILGAFLVLPVSFMILRAFFHKGSLSLYYFESLVAGGDFIKTKPETSWIELVRTPQGEICLLYTSDAADE